MIMAQLRVFQYRVMYKMYINPLIPLNMALPSALYEPDLTSPVPIVNYKRAKFACVKAIADMISNNLAKNCLTAVVIASRILNNFQIPYNIIGGYTQLEGSGVSMPHVWLETHGSAITDLTYTNPMRTVTVLGQSIGFDDDALKPTFTPEPVYTISTRSLPLATLIDAAQNLGEYLAKAPAFVRDNVKATVDAAIDPDSKVTFKGVSEDIFKMAGGGSQ
jgi:hypothetical protein